MELACSFLACQLDYASVTPTLKIQVNQLSQGHWEQTIGCLMHNIIGSVQKESRRLMAMLSEPFMHFLKG